MLAPSASKRIREGGSSIPEQLHQCCLLERASLLVGDSLVMAPPERSDNPFQAGLQSVGSWFNSLPKPQVHLPWQRNQDKSQEVHSNNATSSFEGTSSSGRTSVSGHEASSVSYRAESSSAGGPQQGPQVGPVDKDGLGRATWTFLHVLAAQFPDRPTKKQQKDVQNLVKSLACPLVPTTSAMRL